MLKNLFKRKYIILVLIIIVGVVIYQRSNGAQSIQVEAAEVENRVVVKTVSGSGVVKSQNESDLAFPVGGKITEVNVAKGDAADKGAVLVRVHDSGSYSASQARRDAYDIAQRDLELYIENYETNKDAVGGEDEYEISIRRLRELVSSAQNTYYASLSGLENYYIQAPFGGTVLEVNGEVGEIVAATVPVIKLADLEKLLLEVELDQEDFSFVRPGQKVSITLDAYPDVSFDGEVTEVPLFVDSVDQESFVVKININKVADYPVLLGMDGDVSININSTVDPVNAVTFDVVYFDDEDNPFVWINRDGVLEKQAVEIGLEGDIYTEITSDIDGQVVVPTTTEVEPEPGMKVNISE